MAFDVVSAYASSATPFFVAGQTADTLNEAPQQLTLRFSPGVQIDTTTVADNIKIYRSGAADHLAPGSLLVDDAPNQNQVVIRFKETLPDDSYRIVIGGGLRTVAQGSAPAETFRNGNSETINFRLDLGAFVMSVVPQPITRGVNGLTQDRNSIAVYFNREDPLSQASAQTVSSYRLFEIDPATGLDRAVAAANPASVSYDPATGKAVLTFASGVIADDKQYRLQVGDASAAVVPPAPKQEGVDFTDSNSSFATAANLGPLNSGGATVTAVISGAGRTVFTPAGSLNYPDQPGSVDEPGHRELPAQSVKSAQHGNGSLTTLPGAAIAVRQYNFKDVYGLGTDPSGNTLYNTITPEQKQRAREVFEIFSRYTGVRFEETEAAGMTVATGDPRAVDRNIQPTAVAGIAGRGAAVMNSNFDWGSSEYGGSWFQVALHEIGHLLGLEHSYDLPSIMGGGLTGEPVFAGDYDIEQMIQYFPTNGSDVDMYSFTLDKPGTLSAETIIARPGQVATSKLDSVITLYREDIVGGQPVRTMIARNDDSFGRDSFVGLNVTAGTYFLAVSSTGNTAFDPDVSDSGYGGRTDGAYRLQVGFKPTSTAATTIVDTSGTTLDGDRDGQAGGAFNFWFNTASAANTVYVDKAAANGGNGTLATPYNTIQSAITNIGSKTVIRIVGNVSNLPYLIGTTLQGADLADGKTFNVPKGVTVMIDEGAVLKFRAAILDVGTSSGSISSRASAALQVLGTPTKNVMFTSYHDDAVGGNSDSVGPAVVGGQWGGIVMRADSDSATKKVFLNSVSGATITYGGGQVLVDSQLGSYAPIQLESTRPTLAFNTITNSAGAGIAADPNSFEESDGRTGPEIRGNRLLSNSINGLFVNIRTQLGSVIDKLDVPARLKSTDIVYVLQENLLIDGGVGGYIDRLERTGSTSSVTRLVTNLAKTSDLRVGMAVEGSGIPAGTTIASIDGPLSITLSNQPTATATGVALKFKDPNGFARRSGRLTVDPGAIVKMQGSRIELERGTSQLIAEGTAAKPVIFTSLGDNRFGAGGSFDTNGNLPDKYNSTGVPIGALLAGDWGGFVVQAGGKASIDHAYIAFGGGQTPIEGGFDRFNVIEVHQGDLRVAHSRIENNADGAASSNRDGRGTNVAATIFVRGGQPVILGNDFRDNRGAIVSVNANSLTDVARPDSGRSTGGIDRDSRYDDNRGPLVRDNRISYAVNAAAGRPAGGAIGGLLVRGEEITVESVWDDADIVHVLQNEIIVQNFHTATGIRLMSQSDASLVVKLAGPAAGFTAAGYGLDILDRIGGTVQVVGQPGRPVILTSLKDDSVGASLDAVGLPTKDTNSDDAASTPSAGDWRSLKFLPLSNDRNVSIMQEAEKAQTGGIDRNSTPSTAEVLGVLAPNYATGTNSSESAQEKSGDDNRRLGFQVHGHVALDSSADVDVYSFVGYAGSEVWIDIDKTSTALDTMLELLDANGNVLALSADSQSDALLTPGKGGAAVGMQKDAWRGGDFYTTNPRDAGMRVVLPLAGQPSGTQAQYYVRVRSQPRYDATTTKPSYEADLADPAKVASGATSGAYELRIRLRQQDEKPGSTVRYADIRYPTIGIDVQGLPHNSLLTGENGENATDANGAFGSAQYVGNLLETDRNTISVAGTISGQNDVDWYTFALNYEQIQVIGGSSDGRKSWATVLDIDYGDGFRGDLSLWLFDSTGKLIYAGRDSNVESDQPAAGQGSDVDDLSRGSLGKLDPFIGSAQLPAGNPTGTFGGESGGTATPPDPTKQLRYFVAVSSNEQLPAQLKATFEIAATNSLIRLEPVTSVKRVVEDHIGFTGYTTGTKASGAQVDPTTGALINTLNLAAHVTPFTLSDVTLFVANGNGLRTFDAKTGVEETTIVTGGYSGYSIGDIDMRPDGRLYAYAGINNDVANVGQLMELDAGNGSVVASSNDGIANKALIGPTNFQTNSNTVSAMTFKRTAVGTYDEVWFSVNDGGSSKLYRGAGGGSAAAGGANALANQGFADKQRGYLGRITVVADGSTPIVTGLQFTQDSTGPLYGVTADGRLLQISPNTGKAVDDTLDYDANATEVGNYRAALPAGATGFVGLAAAPQNLENGLYRGQFFALTTNGHLVLIDPASPGSLQSVAAWGNANHLALAGAAGATGLAFSPLDINLWHTTATRGGEDGHGINVAPDNTRDGATERTVTDGQGNDSETPESRGGVSMHFGLEGYGAGYLNYQSGDGQYGVRDGGWQQELTANPSIRDNYNLPGGAYGSLTTNSFSLAGSQKADRPTLYFNYWLKTEANTAGTDGGMVDSARAFISKDRGVTWTVVATNNTTRSAVDKSDAELPTFTSVSANMSTNSNQNVQQLFNSGSWRQARIDLGGYANEADLRLRFDFSTAGEMDATQRDASGNLINRINGVAGTAGDFDKATRGQNNGYEGFYIDDIIVGFAERGEMITGAVAGQTGFVPAGTPGPSDTVSPQSLQGNYQLEIRRGTEYASQLVPNKSDYSISRTFNTNDDLVASAGYLGDANLRRQQGQFLIEGNSVSNALTYGISIDAGARDALTNAPNQGVTASLPVLNSARLVPGVVVSNNIIASSGTAAILFSGDPNTGNVPLAAVPYGRIVNNTLYGGTKAAGVGVAVTENAGPTLLNNVFANLATGISVDGTSVANTVVGTSAYWNTATEVAGGSQSQSVTLAADPFVNASSGNFYLNAGSQAIDSSLNTLADRSASVVVTDAVGIPQSPIIAPSRDIFGQLRIDDPSQASLPGLGNNAFIDRGAIDRVDFAQPSLGLLEPLDGGPKDKDPGADAVRLEKEDARSLTSIVLQLDDVGVGIDKTTVVAAAFKVTRDDVVLKDGTDYVFQYYENTNQVVFMAPAVFSGGAYVITATSQPAVAGTPGTPGLLTDLANNTLLPNKSNGSTSFAIALADVPGLPGSVVPTAGDAQAVLTWSAAAANGSAVTDYEVAYSSNGGNTWTTFPDGTSTALTATVTGLINGTAYVFRVRAINVVGAGEWTAASAPVTPYAMPSAPAGVQAVAGDTQMVLTWTAAAGNGGTIDDYVVQYGTDGVNWDTFADGVSTTLTATVTGLTNGTPYYFRVAGHSQFGNGFFGAATPAPVTPVGAPAAPTNLVGVRGEGQVTLTWTAGSNGGSPITNYVVQYGTDGVNWTTFQNAASAATTQTVTGLTNGTAYFFQVQAVNGVGSSAWSSRSDSVTPVAATAPDAPTGLQVVVGDRTVTLNWTAPVVDGGRPVSDYRVEYRATTSAAWTVLQHAATTSTSAVVSGLTNGVPVVFRVAAVNSVGRSGYVSSEAQPVTPLGAMPAPRRVSGRVVRDVVQLNWLPPVVPRGQRVTDYQIEYKEVNSPTWSVYNRPASIATNAVVSGLDLGKSYQFRVAAKGTTGVAGVAGVLPLTLTPYLPGAVLAAPNGLTVIGGGGRAALSWTATTANQGGRPTDYVIQYRLSGSGSRWVTYNDGSSSVAAANLRGLRSGRFYDFRVAGKNVAGLGAFSAESGPVRV